MAIDKRLTENMFLVPDDQLMEESMFMEESDIDFGGTEEDFMNATIFEEDDGGMTFDFDAGQEMSDEPEFGANLAEYIEDNDLSHCASKLMQMFADDKSSRLAGCVWCIPPNAI